MRKRFSKILVGIFAVVLLLPSIGLAGLKLEQQYPAISGITGQSESLNTAVSQTAKNAPMNIVSLIKYIFTLITVVLIGITTLALIISGVQYLSSAGKVTAQKTARTRVIRSSLGLAIVVLSVVIFQLISPNLNLPQITHIYDSASNVILISDVGMNGTNGIATADDITKEYLDKLADQGQIKYFGSQSGDLTQNFGRLTKYVNSPVSFEDFQPKYIGFFGKGKNNIQVKTFSGKNFLGTVKTYKVDNYNAEGGVEAGGIGSEKIIYFSLPTYLATASNIDWFNTTEGNLEEPQPASKSPSNYPPLSMSVEGISGGVYLYGSDTAITVQSEDQSPNVVGDVDTNDYTKTVGGRGGQRFLQYDIPNFSDSSFDFDNEAMQIEIKNNRTADPSAQDDLLVFLFQGKYYQGPFRAFFEEKKDLPHFDLYDYGNNIKYWFDDKDGIIKKITDAFSDKAFNKTDNGSAGNTPPLKAIAGSKIDINNATDRQGKVFGVSSARVFHLADKNNYNDCQAVALCNGPDVNGYCLVFTPTGHTNGKWMSIFLPMPWLAPIAIPKELPKEISGAMLVGEVTLTLFDKTIVASQKEVFEKEKDFRKFNDNIESIGIQGNCVVALYDNAAKPTTNVESEWDSKTPGAKSMVFAKNDMISGEAEGFRYLNLKNYQIHSCVSLCSALKLCPPHSCVSAVAVYPIK